uniref:Uma2 family endonuclease n=1 Tax=Agathobacter sp. TaxID=2021311 RepID=UPI004055C393
MPLLRSETYTVDYIYSLPEGKRAELIDGVVYDMAPPSFTHQKLINKLSQQITNYIDSKKGNCEVVPAPFAVFLNADDKTYVEPDISVICDKNKLNDRGCNGSPDFIIEIVSPSSRKMDYSTKNALYSNAGVREYWIVDPAKERTTVYRYEEDSAPMIFSFDQSITVGIYGDLKVSIGELLK